METIAGDALTFVFGLPTVHEDDCPRAVRAALELRDALVGLGRELAADGGPARLPHRDQHRRGGHGRATRRPHVRATGEPLTRRPAARSAGPARARPCNAPARSRRRRRASRGDQHDAWIVGGDEFLARHPPAVSSHRWSGGSASGAGCTTRSSRRSAIVPASSSRCSALPASASRGSSRSSSDELGEHAHSSRAAVVLPYGEGITYWPLAEAVNEAVGLDDGAARRLARRLAAGPRRGDRRRARRRAGARPLGLVEAAGGVEEPFAAVRALFESLARTRAARPRLRRHPLGRADVPRPVEYLADWIRDAPILLVCLARPELLDAPAGLGRRQAERDDDAARAALAATSARA